MPIEGFELDGATAVVVIELGRERDVEGPDGQRLIAGPPPDGFVGGDAVGEPHFDVLFVAADTLERTLMNEVAGTELDGRISLAHGFEATEMRERLEVDFLESDFGVETQGWVEIVGLKALAGDVIKTGAKGVEFVGFKAEACGHGVSAVADQQMIALAQGSGEVETGDAAAGAAPFGAVPTDDDGGAIELLEDARSNDPDDADVPGLLAFDDDEIGLRIEPRANGGNGLFGDGAFELLAFTVAGIEALGEREGFGEAWSD